MTTSVCIDLTHDQSRAVSDSQYCAGLIRALDVTQSWPVIGQCLLCSDSHVTDRAEAAAAAPEQSWVQPPPSNTCDWGQWSESYVTIQTSYSSHLMKSERLPLSSSKSEDSRSPRKSG